MKDTINKGIANPHTQPQRIANPLERVGYSKKYFFQQIPSSFDRSHCGNHNCFVIGRGSGYVYGYNSSGTHIKIKTSFFNDPNYFKP